MTGATSGIGEYTALYLATMGAEVLVTGRDPVRVERVRRRVEDAGGYGRGYVADLTDRQALRSLAASVRADAPRLEGLVNSAGAIFFQRSETLWGSERTFALNVEAPFLLTELLLPLLAKSGQGRVVHVASSAHRTGRMHFDDLDLHRRYSAWKAYGQSKLALILLTQQEARAHADLPVTFNACHPGFVRSRFGDEGTGVAAAVFRAIKRLGGRSPERGARAVTFLVSAPQVAAQSGRYFVGARAATPSRRGRDRGDAHRLWRVLEARTGLVADVAGGPAPGGSAAGGRMETAR